MSKCYVSILVNRFLLLHTVNIKHQIQPDKSFKHAFTYRPF